MKTLDDLNSKSQRDITFMKEQLELLTIVTGNQHDLPDIDETLRELLERTHDVSVVLKDVDEHRIMKAVGR